MGPHVILQRPTGLTWHQRPTGLTVRTCGMGVGLIARLFLVSIIDMRAPNPQGNFLLILVSFIFEIVKLQ